MLREVHVSTSRPGCSLSRRSSKCGCSSGCSTGGTPEDSRSSSCGGWQGEGQGVCLAAAAYSREGVHSQDVPGHQQQPACLPTLFLLLICLSAVAPCLQQRRPCHCPQPSASQTRGHAALEAPDLTASACASWPWYRVSFSSCSSTV